MASIDKTDSPMSDRTPNENKRYVSKNCSQNSASTQGWPEYVLPDALDSDKPTGSTTKSFQRGSFSSDNSSFYGNDDQKADLETQANAFDPKGYWLNKPVTLMETAAINKSLLSSRAKLVLYNPYEGQLNSRQLTETVNDFLERLPAATTVAGPQIPWIFIANPYLALPDADYKMEGEVGGNVDMEDENSHSKYTKGLNEPMALGKNFLSEFEKAKRTLQKHMEGQPTAKILAAIAKERAYAVERIKKYAAESNCVSGKWLLFINAVEINAVWSLIAQKTASNDLGTAAKVAPLDLSKTDSHHERLICIYTKDFTDLEDVTRVLRKLKDLGLCDAKRLIYYKCNAYTHLSINSGNEWGISASLYNSKDLLNPKREIS